MALPIVLVAAVPSSADCSATLAAAARTELTFLIGAFAALFAWQLLTGRINTRGLLATRDESGPSGNNVQLLFITLIAAGYYLLQVAEYAPDHRMPPVPDLLLLLIAGSQASFTGGRALTLLASIVTKERKSS